MVMRQEEAFWRRVPRCLGVLLTLITALQVFCPIAHAQAQLAVVDTRTFVNASGEKLRLFNIAVPRAVGCDCIRECVLGNEALDFLHQTLSKPDETARVERYGIDSDGAVRALIYVNGRDLATLLIEAGFARPSLASSAPRWCF
jgi:endonuclease YncB( thermonuclease family)